MDSDAPGLQVAFQIDASGAIDSITQLEQRFDRGTQAVIDQVAHVERATGGMLNLGRATASVTTFGNAATRDLASAAREFAKVEKSGEGLVRSLERQNAAFGKTREELRAMKAEAAATAAEQQGMTELAQRIRDQEAALYDKEFAAARRARAEAEAAAQDKATAAARAVAAAEAEAQAVRSAAFAHQMFEARVREGAQALREQEAAEKAAARDAATAQLQRETAAAKQLADERTRLAGIVRGSQAAQEADAAAAERLRASTDPLYAATQRLNAEIAESTRLYTAGATAPAEYARQQQVLADRLREVERAHDGAAGGIGRMGGAAKLGRADLLNLGYQLNDVFVSLASGQKPAMVFIQQGAQIGQIAASSGVGLRGMAAAIGQVSAAAIVATLSNPILLGIAVTIGTVVASLKALQNAANEGIDLKQYATSLGVTTKEMRHLDDLTVTYGDTAKAVFQLAGRAIWDGIGPAVTGAWGVMKDWIAWVGTGVKAAVNFVIGGWTGAFNVIRTTWAALPAAMGDIFYSTVNAAIDGINSLIRKSVAAINLFIGGANSVLDKVGLHLPELQAGQVDRVANQYAGAAQRVGKAVQAEMAKAMSVDYVGKFAAAVIAQAQANARERVKQDALDKGYLDPEKAKTDKHAEALAREAAAIEAQIRNLYALAAAYKASGAEALIAEARVKAESAAIKKRGEIEAFVMRQIRLEVAQRVADAEKDAATTRERARIQTEINAEIAAGNIPHERANELLQERLAQLPLLYAAEAAQQLGLTTAAQAATAALEDQATAQAAAKAAATGLFFTSAEQDAERRLAVLREENRLVGATEMERARGLATLQAIQTLQARQEPLGTAYANKYIADQVRIAEQTVANQQKQDDYNASLTRTADLWDIIAGKVSDAASGMSEAFGDVGRAIGDVASTFASYQAAQARAAAERDKAVNEANGNEARIARANADFALKTSGAQIDMYGDMASAAKGFFKEGSAGYEALAAAEKAFRLVQFAMSVQAMIQNAAETLGFVTNAAARATADGTAGIAAQSKLPFPFNIAAMAATAAALIAAGVAIFGGGGSTAAPVSNTGTGTVLGDADAKSDSIKRSIDSLKEVDTLTSVYARQMMTSLRSIDNQIGGLAALVVRAGNVDASGNVAVGFQPNVIGSVLGSIPLIGGLLGSLFGSTTSVTGNGLYGGPQTVGEIMGGGFDASYYSDVEKKSKFFGITTGTSNWTEYSAADDTLTSQFTLILREFNDAIVAAAGPLDQSTDAITASLNGFVLDIGKIDLAGLTGEEIEEKLNAVFGAAADDMAAAAFPDIVRFQKVGEGAFATLTRVATTVEAVTNQLTMMGEAADALTIDGKMSLADQFGSVADFTSATSAYFEAFYSEAEQTAAQQAQLERAFGGLNLAMPTTIAGFRALVEAQDLTNVAGQETYAALIQLAPAFAELQEALSGAKSAADIASEREDLERNLLEAQGNTAALRELDLARLDASNRAIQLQIWAIQDAQEAAKAADDLRQAWISVGDSIETEIARIRGLTDAGGPGGFAVAQGSFNAAIAAARAGDQDAARSLPGLSQALLTAAAAAATSRQELARIQAQTAADLDSVLGWINTNPGATPSDAAVDALLDAVATTTAASPTPTADDDTVVELRALREEVAQLRADTNAGNATIAGNTGRAAKKLEDVTTASGGDAISVLAAAA